jgi:diaminopimelate epimerase
MKYTFTKMHGLGNCFILMDDRGGRISGGLKISDLAVAVCSRDFGIGADGLILILESSTADFQMVIINEDGSTAEMCGNGIRCFARFVVEEGITDKTGLSIETGAGVIRTELLDGGLVRVDMGEPGYDRAVVTVRGRTFTTVSMGNPHAVAFVEDYGFDWRKEGSAVETDDAFPQKTNVEYVKVIGPTEADMKVWERGCGETMACGTGACAVAVAGVIGGKLERVPVTIHLPGGDLLIHWNDDNRVMMTGPVVRVCNGTFFYAAL